VTTTVRTSRRLRALLLAVVVGGFALAATACTPPPPSVYDAACAGTLVASTPGVVANASLDELSGLAASRRNPGVWWANNDSGNAAVVYAVGDDGSNLGTFTLQGATNVDWEDIAVGPGPNGPNYLYVADIGNNTTPRGTVVVYRVPEPAAPGSGTLTGVDTLQLTYPNGAKPDAETLIVDPVSGGIYIVTKAGGTATVYRATITGMLESVATLPFGLVTGGDVTAAGDVVALITYTGVTLFPRPSGGSLEAAFAQPSCAGAFPALAPPHLQYEAIGFTPDGRGYVTASEGVNPPLHGFRAP